MPPTAGPPSLADQEELDTILDKIGATGMDSLTSDEKKRLERPEQTPPQPLTPARRPPSAAAMSEARQSRLIAHHSADIRPKR